MAISASPAHTRDLLIKLCGMLGSGFEGERAAAALKVTSLLHQIGWTWDDVLRPPAIDPHRRDGGSREQSPPSAPSPRQGSGPGLLDFRADLACCRRFNRLLTRPERGYVGELMAILAEGRTSFRRADHVRLNAIARRIRRQLSSEAAWAHAEGRAAT